MGTLEIIIAALTFLSGVISFLLTRRSELKWKRTEFIIQQSQFLDTDPEMREITLVLYERHAKKTVDDFLDLAVGHRNTQKLQDDFYLRFEQYLNFLWRISYAHIVLKTLKKKDLSAFGAYLKAVCNNPALKAFCSKEGYEEIVKAYELLQGE